MPYTTQDIQEFVTRKIHGNVSSSFFSSLNEGARKFLNLVDAYETKRQTTLENALYDEVYKYYLPIDVKDQKILDLRKQVLADRTHRDSFQNISNRTFDKYSLYDAFKTYTIEPRDNVKFIKIKDNLPVSTVTLHTADSLVNNGSWNVYGSIFDLEEDKLNYLTGIGSLRFNIDSNTVGRIENVSISPVDLTEHLQVGAIFVWVYLPNPNSLINVQLMWGSSAVDFNTFTVIAPHNNTIWNTGWNLLKFPLDGYNSTGNVNNSAIDRISLEFQTTGSPMTGVRIDNIVAKKGTIYEIDYYSSYLFSDPITGLWKEKSYDVKDIVNLSTTSFNLLAYMVAIIEAQEVRNSSDDIVILKSELKSELDSYQRLNKSEYIKPIEQYYKPIDPMCNRGRYIL